MKSTDPSPEEHETPPRPEYEVDLEELVERGRQTKHNWVDRGAVMSCEGAGHASHRHFKVKR